MGRSMSAVRPSPCISGTITRLLSARLGKIDPMTSTDVDGHVGTVQYDQWPAFAVDLVVHPEAVDLGVVALGSVHPFPFLLAAGARGLSPVAQKTDGSKRSEPLYVDLGPTVIAKEWIPSLRRVPATISLRSLV